MTVKAESTDKVWYFLEYYFWIHIILSTDIEKAGSRGFIYLESSIRLANALWSTGSKFISLFLLILPSIMDESQSFLRLQSQKNCHLDKVQ